MSQYTPDVRKNLTPREKARDVFFFILGIVVIAGLLKYLGVF